MNRAVEPSHPEALSALQPEHPFFVGIDSDGCVFDTMEIKHKECFCPNTILYWHLQPVARYAREAAEFVNLYSRWRGINRWPALLLVVDLLRQRPEVQGRQARVPELPEVRRFVASGAPLSNAGLEAYRAEHPHPELEQALAWSRAVNRSIEQMVHGIPPFPGVRESLEQLRGKADLMVVSATPTEALTREWQEHDLAPEVRVIAGQELGSKSRLLELATSGKYRPGHCLMVGDAPGDLDAARQCGVLFYPINPGDEPASWERFYREALPRFLAGSYQGSYEQALVSEFERRLPEVPPWQCRPVPGR